MDKQKVERTIKDLNTVTNNLMIQYGKARDAHEAEVTMGDIYKLYCAVILLRVLQEENGWEITRGG